MRHQWDEEIAVALGILAALLCVGSSIAGAWVHHLMHP